jgi:hypothetical protein
MKKKTHRVRERAGKPKGNSGKSRPLVIGYLERVSSKIFSGFPRELTDLAGSQHGVYALYKGHVSTM